MFKRLTHARFARAGIASAVIAAAVIVAVSAGALTSGGKSQAANPMSMTVTNPAQAIVGSNFVAKVVGANPGLATAGGYSMELGYNTSILSVVSVADGGANAPGTCTTGAGNWAAPQTTPTVQTGCAFQTISTAGPWDDDVITFKCNVPGSSPLTLVDKITDPISGSSWFDTNAVDIGTDLFSSSVFCSLPITKTVSAGPYLATIPASTVTYTIHVGSGLSVSLPGQTVGDTLPAGLTFVSISSPTDPGAVCSGPPTLGCIGTVQPDPVGLDVVIVASIDIGSTGQTLTNCAQVTPPNGAVSCVPITVATANLSVAKSATLATYQAGDAITWNITVTNTGASTAAGVTVTDTPTDGLTGMAPLSFGPVDIAGGGSVTFSTSGNVTDPNPTDNTCDNSATATATNAASASGSGSAPCLSRNVRMVKSTSNTPPQNSGQLINLFLNKTCGPNSDQLCPLTVNEWALNVGGDPDGVGAFEFQVKYDNHIFDISIAPTNWLYATGRVPGATGIGGCAATIITENDIRFGCVSKNPTDVNGNPIVTIGNKTDGVIATITVTPKADLVNRITPGNDNGAIRSLLDEGCEFADIWGHPLSTNQLDALGREILLPGVGPGGVILDCSDVTITVRILEGDMNLDCSVTVADDQIEASHYGAFFGNLLYQPWYDLEPWLKDGDVDIKDLQKVFGRNGSTCANPVPAQPALPEPVDP